MDHKNHPLVLKADHFAFTAHYGQTRKYTNEPYIEHPREVMALVASVLHNHEMLAAALLHDVVEDCDVSLDVIESEFGVRVRDMVADLTDISRPEDGNRAIRKQKDLLHTALASSWSKTIKLADLISNSKSVTANDSGFARVYMAEKLLLLEVLKAGNKTLYSVAERIVREYYR